MRRILIWGGLGLALALPLAVAATSPLLAWRDAVYITACFAGIVGMEVLLLQPLLAGRSLPGLSPRLSRRLHAAGGALLVAAVAVHVGGLAVTSPPDVVDALLLRAPTAFSVFGVVALWGVVATAVLALARRGLSAAAWRIAHLSLAAVIATGSAIHAILIDGTMGTVTKIALCVLVAAATMRVTVRFWPRLGLRRVRA